jgi:hypothetical protein
MLPEAGVDEKEGDEKPGVIEAKPPGWDSENLLRPSLISSRTASRAPISVKIKQPDGDVHGKACFASKR